MTLLKRMLLYPIWRMPVNVGQLPTCWRLSVALVALLATMCRAQTVSTPRGQEQWFTATSAFAIVSIKPSLDSEADDWGIGIRGRNFWAVHVTTDELIEWAYGINVRQIEHAPNWLATERFDILGIPDTDCQPSREQYRIMLRSALAERFSLRFHASQKVLSVYALSRANGGVKVTKSADQNGRPSWGVHRGWLSIHNMSFENVAQVMQRTIFDRPVLDQTSLSDRYSFVLRWRADDTQFVQMQDVQVPEETGTEDGQDIYTAGRQQLGIKIEAKKALAPIIVVETVSRPSPN